MSGAREEGEYVLGTDDEELRRLRFQHLAWEEHAWAAWRRAKLRAGHRVLDLGSGPGFATLGLASLVGPTGGVIARDRSARYLAFLERERERLGLRWIETSLGPVEELDLPAASLDGVWSRWLFSWLADPESVFRRVAALLRPGAALVLHEYVDWGAMGLLPPSEAYDRAKEACLRGWLELGATIDVARSMPAWASSAGLALESLRPIARIGAVGSFEWRWVGGFLAQWLPRLVERGIASPAVVEAFRADWARREAEGESHLVAPTVLELVLRRP